MPTLEPVDFDPFAKAPTAQPVLEPVDFDPFASRTKASDSAPAPLAPASGVFPEVRAGQGAVLSSESVAPAPQTPAVHAPPPSSAPVTPPGSDPGIMEESYGDIVKGLHSTKRGAFLTGYMTGAYNDVDNMAQHLAASKEIEAQYPTSSASRKAMDELESMKDSGASGLLPALGVYTRNPRLAVSQTIQSLPGMLSSLVTVPVGAVAGAAVAGPPGAAAGGLVGLGVGSAASDFGNSFEEYARDKWKPQTPEEWKAILLDEEKTSEAGAYAAKHAGMVGLFDAVGGKFAGKLGGAVANKLGVTGPVARIPVSMVGGVPASAAAGGAGEAAGGLLGKGEFDPGAVAGEIAGGVVGDLAAGGIESTTKALRLGEAPRTAPTPADVTKATTAVTSIMPVPEAVEGSISAVGGASTFYSPTRRFIEEKGQNAATPDQWMATLRNAPGIKQEELADLGLDQVFAGKDKVTRKEILDHLDENAIRIEETHRDAMGAFGYNADGTTNIERSGNATRQAAQYEAYTLPGERQGYTELTMHLPTRNVEGDNQQRDFVGGHYPEPNTVVHMRVTDRIASDGTPMALIEEIQSDWHQAGRREGYAVPVPPQLEEQAAVLEDKLFARYDRPDGSPTLSPEWIDRAEREGVFNSQEANLARSYGRALSAELNGPVPGPFKQSWDELAFKRALRWAADNGYRRVAWVDAKEQSRRYPGDAKRDKGMQEFYDKMIPSIAKKWAKRLGGTLGETVVTRDPKSLQYLLDDRDFHLEEAKQYEPGSADHNRYYHEAMRLARIHAELSQQPGSIVRHIDLPQNAIDIIQRGLPMYSEVSKNNRPKKPQITLDELAGPAKQKAAGHFMEQLAPAFDALVKQFDLGVPLELVVHAGDTMRVKNANGRHQSVRALGMAQPRQNKATIHIALGLHKTAAEVWATITHELGHLIQTYKFSKASPEVKTAIRAAYDEWRATVSQNDNMRVMLARRDNAVVAYHNTRRFDGTANMRDQSVAERKYWVSFEEWFAEQTARWATSTAKPLTTVERFFKNLANEILAVLRAATEKFQLPFTPAKAMSDWLDSFHTDAAPFAEAIVKENEVKTQTENQRHTPPEEKAKPMQPETVAAREVVDKMFAGRPPKEVQEALAGADKFAWWYKMGLGIHQLATKNPHIAALQNYVEVIAVAGLTKQQIMIRAQEVLKKWNALGEYMADNVAALIDDVQNMVYRTDQEVKDGVSRFPTDAEMQALVAKHNVSQEGLAVFGEVAKTFGEHLTRYEAILRREAAKITDPKKRQARIDAITRQIANLRSVPYFPAMRFGDFTITVRNAANQVIHFETFEKERTRNLAVEALMTSHGITKDQIQIGKLDKTTKPLMGVPTQLLEMMALKLDLSKKQRDALEQLKFELSPAQSFKHRFQHKKRIAGYSQDFRRAYAQYFFHGANHLMKALHSDTLRAHIGAVREETKDAFDNTERHEILAFMNDHLENWLDPKPDWQALRSLAFLLHLAFSPAAAAANLTQTFTTTYPFLAAQFGDVKAAGAILTAQRQISTWYRKGTLQGHTDFELRALGQGIKDGIINEAMAPELAGFAEGGNLLKGFGGNELQRAMNTFNELGAKMFEMAEQMNRRTVFRAALKLAQANPESKYVKAMVQKHKLHYDQLRSEGWTEADATAYVVARDATVETQFQYAREYSPRIMRGKARAVLVFKTFIHSYCMFLGNYPRAAVRSLLILGFMGGLMALPGAEDLQEILKLLGYQLFGKDFDLEKEARKLMLTMVGADENGRTGAEIALHGISKYGYGIPHIMDMLGGTVGADIRLPTLDRSAAISGGTILPVELGKLFGAPTQNTDTVIAGQAAKASGAVLGFGFNIYKSLRNTNPSIAGWKNWEKSLPRAAASLSKAYRYGTTGQEVNSKGTPIIKYDVRDTQQMMEVFAVAMGYTPTVSSMYWDRTMAAVQEMKMWDMRRQGLMKQMGNAVLGRDVKEQGIVKEAIKKFNSELPEVARGKAITSETLSQSIRTQARSRAAQEAESSTRKSDIPIMREVQKLYPDAKSTAVRRVPRAQQPQ